MPYFSHQVPVFQEGSRLTSRSNIEVWRSIFLGSAGWLGSATGVLASARTHPVGLVGPCGFRRRVQEGVRGSSGEALDGLKT